jgi:hypothetical protein
VVAGYRSPMAVRLIPGLAVAALLLQAPRLAAEGTLVLREREAGREKTVRVSVQPAPGGAVLESRDGDGWSETAWADASLFALRMEVSDPAAETGFIAERRGESIRVAGRIRGRQVDRSCRIDNAPWLCLVELCLGRRMLDAAAPPFAFWVLDAATGEPHKLSAQRAGREMLDTPRGPVEAVRVRFTVAGVSPLFWNASWWFRASDGLFLRYEMPRGMPGTPKTILELLAQE